MNRAKKARLDAILKDEKVITTVYITVRTKIQSDKFCAANSMGKGELMEKALIEYMQNHK